MGTLDLCGEPPTFEPNRIGVRHRHRHAASLASYSTLCRRNAVCYRGAALWIASSPAMPAMRFLPFDDPRRLLSRYIRQSNGIGGPRPPSARAAHWD